MPSLARLNCDHIEILIFNLGAVAEFLIAHWHSGISEILLFSKAQSRPLSLVHKSQWTISFLSIFPGSIPTSMTGKKTALTAFHNPLGIHPLTPFDTPYPHWQDVVYCSIPITILHIFF